MKTVIKSKKLPLKTFEDWKQRGRVVIKGEKGIKQNSKKQWLFSLNQTTELKSRRDLDREWSKQYSEEESDDYWPLTAFDLGADF